MKRLSYEGIDPHPKEYTVVLLPVTDLIFVGYMMGL